MLTLDLYNNTALAGTPRSTMTNEFAIKLADPHTSSELYGTIDLKRGQHPYQHNEDAQQDVGAKPEIGCVLCFFKYHVNVEQSAK